MYVILLLDEINVTSGHNKGEKLCESITLPKEKKRSLKASKDMAKAGMLQGEARGCVIRAILNIMDNWKPRLTGKERIKICDYVQEQYGICM